MGAPARHVDSLHMMGVCSLDMDRASDAITHFGTALSASAINDEQRLAVRFELGRAFRSAGDIANARDAFEAVAAVDPLFCDVEQELVELEKLKSEVEADASELQAEIVDDDDYESFDDLLSEVSDGEAENAGKMENSPMNYRLHQSIRRAREDMQRAERLLRELMVEANLAGVPPEWQNAGDE